MQNGKLETGHDQATACNESTWVSQEEKLGAESEEHITHIKNTFKICMKIFEPQ